jgi:hypothetical protein
MMPSGGLKFRYNESMTASFISGIMRKHGGAPVVTPGKVGSRGAVTSELMLGGGQRATLLRAVGR